MKTKRHNLGECGAGESNNLCDEFTTSSRINPVKTKKAVSQYTDLVSLQHRKATTSSLTVAAAFGRSHKSVLRALENVMSDCNDSFTQRNFAPSEYLDPTGRTLPMVNMTRSGFTLIAMGFTGKAATEWKIKYIDAFDKMEVALIQKFNLEWQQSRSESKSVHREIADTYKEFIQYAASQGSRNAQKYYGNLSIIVRKALGVDQPRDVLGIKQLSFVSAAEHVIQQNLEEGMSAGLHYKDIFQLAKRSVYAFAKTLDCQCQIVAKAA